MRQLLTAAFVLSLLAGGIGCSNKGVELDTTKTVAFKPGVDSEPVLIGPSDKGGLKKGKGAGAGTEAPAK
jgi:hypothetical protein